MRKKLKKNIKFIFCLDEQEKQLLMRIAERHRRNPSDTLRLFIHERANELGFITEEAKAND